MREERHRKPGEPPETVTGSVGAVTFSETGRFPYGRWGNRQEGQTFAQVGATRHPTVSGPLSFRYVRYVTRSTAGEGRQDIDRVTGSQRIGLVAHGDSVAQIRASPQHRCQPSTRGGEPLNPFADRGPRAEYHHLGFGARGRARGREVAHRDLDAVLLDGEFSHRSRSSGGRAG